MAETNQASAKAVTLQVNGKEHSVTVLPDTPLLWVLREQLGLTGTKFGCGMALCGACTVLVNGTATRSCVTPVSAVSGKSITTIEGLSPDGTHPVQRAWIEDDVPQCGYCPFRTDHVGCGPAGQEPQAQRRRHRRLDVGQHLPLRHVSENTARHPPGLGHDGRRCSMSPILNLSRREFLRASGLAGGGLILGFYFAPVGSRGRAGAAQAHAGPFVPNAFIRISPDDTVTLIINKSEMGQGVYTSLPMLIAEELECDWNKIHLEPAPVAPAYNHTEWGAMQGTGGSSSVRSEWERLRLAGASAREMLIAAAAATWRVDPGSCRAQKSKVIHPDGKTLTFGELALKAADLPVPKKVTLKDPAKFKLIGRSTKRLDTPEKTDGKALFGLDAQVPGMLVALIARPPVFGGKVKSLDAEKTRAFPGVREVFQIPSGVAVVADSFWPAKKGRDLLQIVWDDGEGASLSTASMRKEYERLADTPGMVSRRDGDTAKAFRGAAQKFSAEYEVPYLAHAMMEPLNCLVDFRQDSCEIRTGTQFQTADRDAAARILGLKKKPGEHPDDAPGRRVWAPRQSSVRFRLGGRLRGQSAGEARQGYLDERGRYQRRLLPPHVAR